MFPFSNWDGFSTGSFTAGLIYEMLTACTYTCYQ